MNFENSKKAPMLTIPTDDVIGSVSNSLCSMREDDKNVIDM